MIRYFTSGRLPIDVLISFCSGAIFLILDFLLALFVDRWTGPLLLVWRVTLALAVGCLATLAISRLVSLNANLKRFKLGFQAGGAIVMMTIVYLVNPPPFLDPTDSPHTPESTLLQPGYDFLQQASTAQWSNGSISLTFPGQQNDAEGYVYYTDFAPNAVLENGKPAQAFLSTHPEWVPHGTIEGKYGPFLISHNIRIIYQVGLGYGAIGSHGVAFRVEFEEINQPDRILLLRQVATYNEKMTDFMVDLDQIAGKEGYINLSVDALDDADQDWAIWTIAKVVRSH